MDRIVVLNRMIRETMVMMTVIMVAILVMVMIRIMITITSYFAEFSKI